MWWTLTLSTAFLFSSSTSLARINGRDVRAQGNGPPILFSPGLFGAMSPHLYSRFLKALSQQGVTVITLQGFGDIRRQHVEEVADVIGAKQIGVLTHSSFDVDILDSERVHSALLMDPSSLPQMEAPAVVSSRRVLTTTPTLVIKAERTYKDEVPFVPQPFAVDIDGPDVQAVNVSDVGHVDILDDMYAGFGERVGISVMRREAAPFLAWSAAPRRPDRQVYRMDMAQRAAQFFVRDDDAESDAVH